MVYPFVYRIRIVQNMNRRDAQERCGEQCGRGGSEGSETAPGCHGRASRNIRSADGQRRGGARGAPQGRRVRRCPHLTAVAGCAVSEGCGGRRRPHCSRETVSEQSRANGVTQCLPRKLPVTGAAAPPPKMKPGQTGGGVEKTGGGGGGTRGPRGGEAKRVTGRRR
jgi:hypothetical protein